MCYHSGSEMTWIPNPVLSEGICIGNPASLAQSPDNTFQFSNEVIRNGNSKIGKDYMPVGVKIGKKIHLGQAKQSRECELIMTTGTTRKRKIKCSKIKLCY